MPMTVCEEAVDLSWMESKKTKMLSEVIGCTDVGPVRDQLSRRLIQYVNEELVESPGLEAPGGLNHSWGDHPGEDECESIFDYGGKIGLLPDSEGDCWIHDRTASTWTRVIVVPRKEFFHPSEGLERSTTPGPMLANLGGQMKTITSSGK